MYPSTAGYWEDIEEVVNLDEWKEQVYKPNSVPSELSENNIQRATVIPLAQELPLGSGVLPGCQTARVTPPSLFGFAPCGVCQACLLLSNRCALTAPFHPYLKSSDQRLVVSD